MSAEQLVNIHVTKGGGHGFEPSIPNTGLFGGAADFLSTNRLAFVISVIVAFAALALLLVFLRRRFWRAPDCWRPPVKKTRKSLVAVFLAALSMAGLVPIIVSAASLMINVRDDVIDVTIDKSLSLAASAPSVVTLENDTSRPYYVTAELVFPPTSSEVGRQIMLTLGKVNDGVSLTGRNGLILSPIAQSIYANDGDVTGAEPISLAFPIQIDIANDLPEGDYAAEILYRTFYEDDTPPVIVINGADVVYHEVGTPYADLGASAIDDVDGVVSVYIISNDLDVNQLGTYMIIYGATDSMGNTGMAFRTVIVRDTTPPVISVEPTTVNILQGGSIDLMDGVTAVDNYDGDLTDSVIYQSSPDFDNTVIGSYLITYDVTDSSGNAAVSKTRIVNVTDGSAPQGEASYSTTEPTNEDVVVTITTDRPIDTPDGWTKIDDTHYTKNYSENTDGTEQVVICTAGSNGAACSEVDVEVGNIDKTPPELDVTYDPSGPAKTNLDVVATIVSNEPLAGPLPDGWTQVDTNTYQKTYPQNTTEQVTFYDLAGNPVTADIEITWIDKAPRIISISPTRGPTVGGTVVTITGSNFTAAANVTLDGFVCTVSSATTTTIVCNTPAHIAGPVDVRVSTVHGNDVLEDGFTYVAPPQIDDVAPNPSDPADDTVEGGDTITIIGDNLDPIDGIYVDLDKDGQHDSNETCTNVVILPNTPSAGKYTVTCTLPDGANGSYEIVIETPGGSDHETVEYDDGTTTPTPPTPPSPPTVTPPAADGSTIQSVTAAKCTAATVFDGTNTGAISIVKDSRDNRYYAIAKMPDNKCWMLTNLAYNGNLNNNGLSFGSMTHYDGNGTSSWPTSTTTAAYYTDPHEDSTSYGGKVSGGSCPSLSYRTSAAAIDFTECGFLYNLPAATAGTASVTSLGGDATASICPTGWRLPKGARVIGDKTSTNELNALLANLGNNINKLVGTGSVFRAVYSGYYNPQLSAMPAPGLINQGTGGSYWSATRINISGDVYFSTLSFSSGSTPTTSATSSNVGYYGAAVRCVLK